MEAMSDPVFAADGLVMLVGPNHDGVAVDGHGVAEEVARRGVGGRQLVRDLRPACTCATTTPSSRASFTRYMSMMLDRELRV